ncbi:Pre-mRNA splicing factor PRP21 like protein-domain-containing protein [Cladochytrium replicatum]|nr:Pre-mRNA splicing factor PRP21 like protein-domain-containing protein [Cladochytrium replicatum]
MAPSAQPRPPPPPKNVKIRTDYVPKAKKQKALTSLCPRCNKPIPLNELDEHVRIELLDPRWREQRQRAMDKTKDTNLVTNVAQVTTMLKKIAEFRTDIFGGDELEVEKKLREEKFKAAQKEKAVWDGHTATIGSVTQKVAGSISAEELYAREQKAMAFAAQQMIGPRVPGVPMPEIPEWAPGIVHPLPPRPFASGSFSISAPHMSYEAAQYIAPQPASYEISSAPYMYQAPATTVPPQPFHGNLTWTAPATRDIQEDRQSEQPPAKRARVDEPPPHPSFLYESEFIRKYPGPITLHIRKPVVGDDPKAGEWQLDGSSVAVSALDPKDLVSTLKERLSSITKIPYPRIKLTAYDQGAQSIRPIVLKDTHTVAYYNLRDGESLALGLRERGGKK